MRNTASLFAYVATLCFVCGPDTAAHAAPSLLQIAQHRTPNLVTTINSHRYDGPDDDYDYDDDGDDTPARVDPDAPSATYLVPEWLPPPRPANCGQFHYWNGTYCADAREQPPYVGPRW